MPEKWCQEYHAIPNPLYSEIKINKGLKRTLFEMTCYASCIHIKTFMKKIQDQSTPYEWKAHFIKMMCQVNKLKLLSLVMFW